jgi:hypothetical protein
VEHFMPRKNPNQQPKTATGKPTITGPVEDLIRRALSTKRPATGWPWEKHQGKSSKK